MTIDEKRDELRQKIEIAESRQKAREATMSERATEAAGTARDFAKNHPVATVLGGIAAGLLIGSMFKGGRRIGAQAGRRAGGFASSAGRIGMSFARDAMLTAGAAAVAGKDTLEDLGDGAGSAARNLKRGAAYKLGSTSDTARALTRKASRSASRAVRDVRGRIGK
ncbi:hypothetical protein [Altererythrobacter aquiaggeris]|uniref:hypothetical protein n=1 Tax=Aestuarierythrobacter aquiaggeris TaxID=1898396 RepID=UPI0030164033